MSTAEPALPAVPDQPASSARIELLDVVRGFALFGILVMNIPLFSRPAVGYPELGEVWTSLSDQATVVLMKIYFDSKFNALFSFLFGMGFALQWRSLQRQEARPAPVYLRRVATLLLLGLAHMFLLWYGDVLTYYALIGVPLLLLRNVPAGGLLLLAGLALAVPVAMQAVQSSAAATPAEVTRTLETIRAREIAAFGGSDYLRMIAMRAEMLSLALPAFIWLFCLELFGTSLIGFVVGRDGWLARWDALRMRHWVPLLIGLGTFLGVVYAEPHWFAPEKARATVGQAAKQLGRIALMLGYAGLWRLALDTNRFVFLTSRLAIVGRMPLTNYLLQTIVCTTIFYGYGFGQFNQWGPAATLCLALVLYGLQVLLSLWWLRRYQYGPLDWLWRVATYGRPLPFRRTPRSRAAAV